MKEILLLFIFGLALSLVASCNAPKAKASTTGQVTLTHVKTESDWTCSVCRGKITGRGYQETSEGVWNKCYEPYQYQICSPECGSKHTGIWQDIQKKIQLKVMFAEQTY